MKKKKRKIGGNTETASIKSTKNFYVENQKAALKDFKYALQAQLRSEVSTRGGSGIKTSGRPSAFAVKPRNPATKPATKKFVNPRPKPKKMAGRTKSK